MTATLEIPEYLGDLFPDAGPELMALFAGAAENAGLVQADFLTLKDLVELSGYTAAEPLHALLLAMLLALEEGSLCVEVSEAGLMGRLIDLVDEPQARAWASRILTGLETGYPELIASSPDAGKPVVLWPGDRFLYFQKYLRHDLLFREEVGKRLASPAAPVDAANLRAIVQEILVVNPLHLQGKPLVLDPRQRLALGVALVQNFAIISGGPGTGKTSIVFTLLRCLVRQGIAPERIALAAPTGRAAQRLTDSVRAGLQLLPPGWKESPDAQLENLPAHTLHHLLHYHPTRGTFGHHVENPVPAEVVIVDEVSMVGLVLMAQLLQALRPETRLILLGDKDQLPSVEVGAVLASLVLDDGQTRFSPRVRTLLHQLVDVEVGRISNPPGQIENLSYSSLELDYLVVLEANYRSQAHIREVAAAINRQESSLVDNLPVIQSLADDLAQVEAQGGCWLLPQPETGTAVLRQALESWAKYQFLSPVAGLGSYEDLVKQGDGRLAADKDALPVFLDRLFRLLARSRILTLVREGPWGCVNVNGYLDQILRPRCDRHSRGLLFAGAPVLITRNDHARQLFNGDVGIALRCPGGGLRVVFPRPEGLVSFPADSLPAHELGFALTVHKSQGSEYDHVLLLAPPSGGRRLLTKELLYTAVTRAKHLAILAATRAALQFAIGRKMTRESGLRAAGFIPAGECPPTRRG